MYVSPIFLRHQRRLRKLNGKNMRMIQSCSKTKTENQISWNTIYKAEVSRREGFCFKPCSVSTALCRHVLPMPPSRIHWANGCRHPVNLQCRWSMLECEAMTFTFSHPVSIIPALRDLVVPPALFCVQKPIHQPPKYS